MYQTEALPDGFRASIWGIKKHLFAERIVEHSPEADNSLYGRWLHLSKKASLNTYRYYYKYINNKLYILKYIVRFSYFLNLYNANRMC